MELALSLGDASKSFKFLDKVHKPSMASKDLGPCMGLGIIPASQDRRREGRGIPPTLDPPLQLDLLPFSPVHSTRRPSQIRFPWLVENQMNEAPSGDGGARRFDIRSSGEDGDDAAAVVSSPNSSASFQMDFGFSSGNGGSRENKIDLDIVEIERTTSRGSDDEDNGLARKKLRLSKEQSAFLEESFKEHNTLNPKQKLALAKQLNLRPRQVEVWFQNRRARTKLKQTEVDCEYLKRCCETLTEENRRLQKELQELRALKTSQPYYMQLPATTLTMCPSCERVATATTNPNPISAAPAPPSSMSKHLPFCHVP